MTHPFSRSRGTDCLSDFLMDQMLVVDGPQEARAHMVSCEMCAERYREFEAQRVAFQTTHPRRELPKTTSPTVGWLRWLAPAMGSLVVAAVTIFYVAGSGGETTTTKGSSRLGFFVRRGDVVSEGGPGTLVRPGDSLQFRVSGTDAKFVAVLSVDGNRLASIYFPSGPRAAYVALSEDRVLPASTILDDVLGKETLFGLFCHAPIELEPVRAQLEQRPDGLQVPDGCEVDTIVIEKRP